MTIGGNMDWILEMEKIAGYESAGYEDLLRKKAIDFLEMVLMSTEEE